MKYWKLHFLTHDGSVTAAVFCGSFRVDASGSLIIFAAENDTMAVSAVIAPNRWLDVSLTDKPAEKQST